MHLDFKDVLEIITLAFLILGSTWRLSSQMTSLNGKVESLSSQLAAHTRSDDDRFSELESTLNTIAPRVVRLERRTR